MNSNEPTAVREATQKMRQPPREPIRITASFDGNGELDEGLLVGPIELTIEATNLDGDLAPWFDDYWWIELIERWGDQPVTLHIAPTPDAVAHPVVLHQMEMVSRVASRWRMVGHGYRGDISTDDAIELLAASPYHEVRFIDQGRPDGPIPARRGRFDLAIEDLFGRIRREQIRIGATRPVLVRLPSGAETHTAEVPAPKPHAVGTA
ncbi:MAG: hypothetical protein ACYTFA_05300 [Planctomycetota bacterium]|jgi:hypothetical protein